MIEITIWNYSVVTVENTTEDASRRVENFISSSIYKGRLFQIINSLSFFLLAYYLLLMEEILRGHKTSQA